MKKLFSALFIISLLSVGVARPAWALRYFYTKGSDGAAALTPPNSDTVYNYQLAANTAQTVTWPSGANYAIISGTATYYVGAGAATAGGAGQTATIPVATSTTGSGSMPNLAQIARNGDASFSIISSTAQNIGVAFYQ